MLQQNLNILIVLSFNILVIFAAPQLPLSKEITEIPSDIPICSENDKRLNECIRDVFQQMLPRTKNGIPDLNIPPMDPLEIGKTSYDFKNSIIEGKVALRNVKIHGLSDTVFDAIDYKRNGNKIKLDIKSRTPKLFIEGKYKAEVKINDARMNSKGVFNLTMTGVDVKASPEAELYERDGKKYIRLVKLNVDPTLADFRLYATGLVPDPILNEALLEFVNQNWRTSYKTIISETRPTWESEFFKIGNEYFSHIPFDLLFSKD